MCSPFPLGGIGVSWQKQKAYTSQIERSERQPFPSSEDAPVPVYLACTGTIVALVSEGKALEGG